MLARYGYELNRRRSGSANGGLAALREKPYATFETEQQQFDLFGGYRDCVKPTWRLDYWPVAVLYSLPYYHETALPDDTLRLLDATRQSPTLAAPLEEYLQHVKVMTNKHPEKFSALVDPDAITLDTRIYTTPTEKMAQEFVTTYDQSAQFILETLWRNGYGQANARTLEIGCGTAMNSLFLMERGSSTQAVGIDINLQMMDTALKDKVAETRGWAKSIAAEIRQGDFLTCPIEGESYDLVFGTSVLEHFPNPRLAFERAFLALRPGGYAFLSYGQWFGPGGGHARNTYDFPWGHVLLSAEDAERYLKEYRPYEAAMALHAYRSDFNEPRLTSSQMESIATKAGFQILDTGSTRDWTHVPLISGLVLEAAQRHFPQISPRDLWEDSGWLVLRKSTSA